MASSSSALPMVTLTAVQLRNIEEQLKTLKQEELSDCLEETLKSDLSEWTCIKEEVIISDCDDDILQPYIDESIVTLNLKNDPKVQTKKKKSTTHKNTTPNVINENKNSIAINSIEKKNWFYHCPMCKITYKSGNGKICSICGATMAYQCKKCKNMYSKYLSCYMHIRRKCYPEDFFNCNDCSYTTHLKSSLRHHIQIIHLESSQQCPRCFKHLKNSHSLRSHLEHCGKAFYSKCEYCSFKTAHKRGLKRHVLRRHTYPIKDKYPSQKCFKCGENIRSILSHTKNCGKHRKFFHCDLCQYKQSSKWNLENHLRKKHPEIW